MSRSFSFSDSLSPSIVAVRVLVVVVIVSDLSRNIWIDKLGSIGLVLGLGIGFQVVKSILRIQNKITLKI